MNELFQLESVKRNYVNLSMIQFGNVFNEFLYNFFAFDFEQFLQDIPGYNNYYLIHLYYNIFI